MTQVPDAESDLRARAEVEMDRTPPEPAHRQAARGRYDRRLVRFSVVLALLLVLVGPLARPFGSRRELTRPLEWLSGRQREEPARQVRGGDALPTRLPLARLQARR